MNGQRADSNVFTVDGVSGNALAYASGGGNVTTGGNLPALNVIGGTQSLATADAIEELKVQTSTFSAEFGRQPGGQFQIVTKSGTNTYHGTAYTTARNEFFEATAWFQNANNQPKGKLRQWLFGGTLGGPLDIPKVYQGKDRTFFFMSLEHLDISIPKYSTQVVPDAATRASAAPVVQPFLKAIPLPNGIDRGVGMANLYLTQNLPTDLWAGSIRLDHNFSSTSHAFYRYSNSPTSQTTPYPEYNYILLSTFNSSTAGLTWTATPSLVNDFHANWTESTSTIQYKYLEPALVDIRKGLPAEYQNDAAEVEYYIGAAPVGGVALVS